MVDNSYNNWHMSEYELKMSLREHNFIANNTNQKPSIIKTKMQNVFIYFI